MKRTNPTLSDGVFDRFRGMGFANPAERMSINGTLNKSLLLVVIALITAAVSWSVIFTNPGTGYAALIIGAIVGFITAIYTTFKPENSPISAPIYAAAEGIVLGAISAVYSAAYGGIVSLAVPLTVSILFLMLGLYRAGILRATPVFTRVIVIATGGIAVVYMINLMMSFFGAGIHLQNLGPLGIAISLFICGVAALNFILDFDFIERAAESGAPKYMEWYSAFSICVTLFWLYLEILRLLSLLSGNNNRQ